MSYDNNYLHDHAADQAATEEAKLSALAAEIRAGFNISDFIDEIEISASFDDSCCHAITQAFMDGTSPAILLHNYALNWLDVEADRLAKERMK
jgi:hypothetical protein